MLIVDRDAKTRNDRTWCFWTTQPTCFDRIVAREWTRFNFVGDRFEQEIGLENYRYKLIRGIDLYRTVHQELSGLANVEFLQGNVERVEDGTEVARVYVGGQEYSGRWLFDSRFNPRAFQPQSARDHCLWQHFKGWEIETAQPAFNPDAATLLDFRTPQRQAMRFFYVLPFSRQRALVEYVSLGRDDYDSVLREYVEKTLQIRDYRIMSREGGVSPLTDYVFPRRAGGRIMDIGTRGGRIKPSTGYAFVRIQQDSQAIVRSLIANGHPFDVPSDSRRYRLYDSLMLDIMRHHGGEIKPIFTALFKKNPISRVLRFLDEEGSPAENALLIASLPPKLFLQALFQFHVSPLGFLAPDHNSVRPMEVYKEDE
jgi:lycopene beta-cyclase